MLGRTGEVDVRKTVVLATTALTVVMLGVAVASSPSSGLGPAQGSGPPATHTTVPASPDTGRHAVHRLYLAYFQRDPDPIGLNYWVRQYQLGRPLSDISEHFAGSDEFGRRYGSLDDADFVELIYANLFDRSSDPAGLAYWTQRLARGQSRGSVMVRFSESAEFRRITGLD